MTLHYAYVAADPTQPGAAWAIATDDPRLDDVVSIKILGWLRNGAHVRRVDADAAIEMVRTWKRPIQEPRP